MPVVDENVLINRAPQDVFDFIMQAENLPVWDVSVIQAQHVGEDPTKLGARTEGASKILGKQFTWTTEVTEFEPASRVTWTSVAGPMQFTVSYALKAEHGGTRLDVHIDAASGLGGVFGRLADPLIATVQGRTVRGNLETLADLLADQSGG